MLHRTTAALILAVFVLTSAHGAETRPNIVFIMADDLGNADLGYRGSEIKTPNIDKLADDRRAVRVVLRHARVHALAGRADDGPLPDPSRPSDAGDLPEPWLRPADRRADAPPGPEGRPATRPTWSASGISVTPTSKYWPQNRGFDHFYGNLVGEVDYFTKQRGGLIDWQRNGKFFKDDEYFTTLIGNEAVKLIEAQDPAKPFFLYFASLAPHAPYQVPEAI